MTTAPRSAAGSVDDTLGKVYDVCVDADGFALGGNDATSYFDCDAPLPGNPEFEVRHGGARYVFADADRMAKFAANPDAFAPAFGGFCAKAVSENDVFWVNPNTYIIQDGRLLMFFNDEANINTKAMWEDSNLAWGDGSHPDGGSMEERLAEADRHWKAGPPSVKQVGGGRQPKAQA
uniref:YHS domain-containing protein n=1 Tax=Phaeomonas parva TaxID=124430 RepID=A0A7S1UBL0_9STRA|mmetsp:Transcript_40644/g.127145  ORF Transcript_40644/g.127145 Transcript_40644/m.127145 type:complete len:177 (+) Transcript_40644:109-639(+)